MTLALTLILGFSALNGIDAHADFLMADASYRTNSEGKMYCHADIDADKTIMGLPVKVNDTFEITIGKSWLAADGASKAVQVFFSGNGTGNEFIFDASDGKFADGGCMGRRSEFDVCSSVLSSATVYARASGVLTREQ